jgi:hypothetical protein
MSGLVSAAAGIAGAVSEILGLGGGDVTLGGATFTDLALPWKMTWGGHQRLVRHVAPGGVVVMSSLGPDWKPICWSGVIEGPGASARAKLLYAMMLSAQAIPLAWLDQLWIVVIQEFCADDTTIGWVPYRITCAVSADPSQIARPGEPPLSNQVQADINNALALDVVDNAGAATPAMIAVQQQAAMPNALTFGSAAFTTLTENVDLAQVAIGNAISQTESGLNALGGSEVSGSAEGLTWVNAAATQTGNLANAVAANGLLGRIATNLANAST